MKKSFIKTAVVFLITLNVLLPTIAFADTATGYTPLEPLPCISGGGIVCATNGETQPTINFKDYVQYMFNLLIALAAAAAVFMMVLGGLEWMTTDSWMGKKDGKQKVMNALYGLLLILISYMILRTIDPRLVAIPTSLVPKIDTSKLAQQKTDSFLSLLDQNITALQTIQQQSQAAKEEYNKMIQEATANRTQITQDQAALNTAKSKLINDAGIVQSNAGIPQEAWVTDPDQLCTSDLIKRTEWYIQIRDQCNAYLGSKDKYTQDSAAGQMILVKGTVESTLSRCFQVAITDVSYPSCKADIQTSTQKYVETMISLGQDPQPAYDYVKYGQDYIDLSERYTQGWASQKKTLTSGDYGQIVYYVNNQLSEIKSDSVKNLLIQKRNSIITSLGGSQASIDDGSYLSAYKTQMNNLNRPPSGGGYYLPK